MAISIEDVEHIAWLARLSLSNDEKARLVEQLSQILDHASRIQDLDLAGVKPTTHALKLENVLREDKEESSLTSDEAVLNSPAKEGEFFSVPRIIGKDD